MDCYWHIQPTMAAGQAVAITINSLSTESGYDFLTIHNGTTSDAPIVVSLSGTMTGIFLCSTGACTVHFHTDQYVEASGFSFTYAVAGPVPVVTAVSPSYAVAGQTPLLTVTGANFRPSAVVRLGTLLCTGVSVSSDGTSLTCTAPSNLGYGVVTATLSVANPDGMVGSLPQAYSLWEASSALCPSSTGTVFTNTQGSLSMGTYTNNLDCFWHFVVPHAVGQAVVFSFSFLSTESCCDSVRIYNGSTSLAPRLMTAAGTTYPSEGAACTSDVCTVRFTSDQSIVGNGFTLNWALSGAAPVLSAVTPASAAEYTSTVLRIDGSNIRAGASVRVGNSTCAVGGVYASGYLTCTLPNTVSAGVYSVVVTNADYSQGVLASSFTALSAPPTVTGISPAAGASMRAVPVVVSGSHFRAGATVTVGGYTCSSPSVSADGTYIACITSSSLSTGSYTVVVRNSDASLASLLSAYSTYESSTSNCPSSVNGALTAQYGTITLSAAQYTNNMQCTWRVQPEGVSPNTLVVITIDSIDTESCCDRLTVYNGTSSSSPQIMSAYGNYIPAPARCSAAACTVRFTSDTSVTGNGFVLHYAVAGPAPTLSSVSPTTAYELLPTNLTLTGTNFRQGASVTVGSSPCSNVVVASNGQSLTCVSANDTVAGTYNVVITNPDATTATLASAITLRPRPHVDSVSPIGGGHHTAVTLTLSGTHFSSPTVTVGGLTCTLVYTSSSTLRCTTSSSLSMGSYDVVVRNADGASETLPSAFYAWDVNVGNCPSSVSTLLTDTPGSLTVTASEYTNGLDCYWHVSPVRENGESIRLAVSAIDTESCCDYLTFYNGPDTRSTSLLSVRGTDSGSSATCTSTLCTIHFHTDGSVTRDGFTVTWDIVGSAPLLESVYPNTVQEASSTSSIYIYGDYIRQGATATVGGVTCTVLYIGSSYLNCQPSSSLSVGLYDIVVTNPNGRTGTLAGAFAVQGMSPQITSVDPEEVEPWEYIYLTIRGSNFRDGATVTLGEDEYNCTNPHLYMDDFGHVISCTVEGGVDEGYHKVIVRNADRTSTIMYDAIHATYNSDAGLIAAIVVPVVFVVVVIVLACIGCCVHRRHQVRVAEWRKKNAASDQRARTAAVQLSSPSTSSPSPIVVSAATSSPASPPPMVIRMGNATTTTGAAPAASPMLGVTELSQGGRSFTVVQPPPAALYPTFAGDSVRSLDQPAAIPSSFAVTVGPEAYYMPQPMPPQPEQGRAPVPMVPSAVAELKAVTYTPPQPQPVSSYWSTDAAAPPPYYVTLPSEAPSPMVVMQSGLPQMQMDFMPPPVMYTPSQPFYAPQQPPSAAPSPRPATAAAPRPGSTMMVNAASPRPATANGGQMVWMMPSALQPAMRTNNNQEQHQQEMMAMMQSPAPAAAPAPAARAPEPAAQDSMVPAYIMTAQGPMVVMMPRPAQSQLTL